MTEWVGLRREVLGRKESRGSFYLERNDMKRGIGRFSVYRYDTRLNQR